MSTPSSAPSTTPSSALRWVAVPLMLLAGGMVAVQSQLNGQLADEIGAGPRAGFLAACISFGSGLVLLVSVTVALPRQRAAFGRLVTAVRRRDLRPVELVGGLLGAFLVSTQGLTVATIGVALFSVALTAGQSVSALAVDRVGLGPAGRQHLTAPRVVAAAFAVLAVVLAAGERLLATFSWQLAIFALLPFLAGAGSSVQQALNGRVARHAGPWITTLNNFVVGTAGLLVAFALSLLADGRIDGLPDTWWLYLGGLIGITFIWLAALLVHVHGVLVLSLSMIAGQVLGAELIEAAHGAHVGPIGMLAGGLTVLGVVVALGLRRR